MDVQKAKGQIDRICIRVLNFRKDRVGALVSIRLYHQSVLANTDLCVCIVGTADTEPGERRSGDTGEVLVV